MKKKNTSNSTHVKPFALLGILSALAVGLWLWLRSKTKPAPLVTTAKTTKPAETILTANTITGQVVDNTYSNTRQFSDEFDSNDFA